MQDVAQHQLPYSKVRIQNLLNPAEEDHVIESVATESQLDFIIGNSDDTELNTRFDDEDKVYTTAEELKAPATATNVLEEQGRMTTGAQIIIRAS